MKYLEGIMKLDDFELKVNIMFIPPSEYRIEEWTGDGICNNYIGLGKYETNIGTIIIKNVSLRDKDFFVEFIGNGEFLGFNDVNKEEKK